MSMIRRWFAATFLRDDNITLYRRDAQGTVTGGTMIGESDFMPR